MSRSLPDDWNSFRRKQCEQNPIPKKQVNEGKYILLVIGVIDGDSVCAQDEEGFQYQIRLDGIDAPEFRQSHSFESKRFLAEKIWQKDICLVMKEFDRYGRIIGRLYPVEDGKCWREEGSINLAMVREGWAWMYRYFFEEGEFFSRQDFEEAEETARQERKGLWENPDPQNPYDCRRNKKSCR